MSLLDNLFVNLRVISKIPEGGRISTTGAGQIKIEDSKMLGGWITTGRRRLTGDSRDESVKVLMQTINDATELSDNIIDSLRTDAKDGYNVSLAYLNENSKKCHQLQKLGDMLKRAKKGIVNLYTTTYADDANTTARLDEVLDKIDQQYETIMQVLEYMKNHRDIAIVDGKDHIREHQKEQQREQKDIFIPSALNINRMHETNSDSDDDVLDLNM